MQNWYALYTQPKKERVVRDLVQSRHLQVFLPLVPLARGRRAHRLREEPLFARYLFVRFDPQVVSLVSMNRLPGVTRVVSFYGEAAVVPDAAIEWLRERLEQQPAHDCASQRVLQPQDRLRIMAGPLAGLEAVFDQHLSSEKRARVFVNLLGRSIACTVDVDWLQPS